MVKCAHCPLAGQGRPCKAEITRHHRYCELVDPHHPAHEPGMVDRLLAFSGEGGGVTPGKPPAIPLAGDLVAALTARIGADRAAKWLAKTLWDGECGCAARAEKLNALDSRLRRWLGISSPR